MFWRSVFAGIKEARDNKLPKYHYDNLDYTPFLYSSERLFQLYDDADEEQKEKLHWYINDKFDVANIGKYNVLNEMLEKDLNKGGWDQPASPKRIKNNFFLDDLKGDW